MGPSDVMACKAYLTVIDAGHLGGWGAGPYVGVFLCVWCVCVGGGGARCCCDCIGCRLARRICIMPMGEACIIIMQDACGGEDTQDLLAPCVATWGSVPLSHRPSHVAECLLALRPALMEVPPATHSCGCSAPAL